MNDLIPVPKNGIVVYQPNETTRIDVRLENESVWLSQAQIGELFGKDQSTIARHINNVFSEGEVEKSPNMHFLHISNSVRPLALYSLNVIISVGYRVKSVVGTQFRIWATRIIQQRILGQSAFEPRMTKLENRMDALELELKRAEPLPEQIFCEGQMFDAYTFFCDLIRRAKTRVFLIDNYVNDSALFHLSPLLFTSSGASLKDAGKKKFAIIRMALSPDAILPKGAAK